MLLSADIRFERWIRFVTMEPWTLFQMYIPNQTVLLVICRGVSGWETDSPCSVGAVNKLFAYCRVVHLKVFFVNWLVCKG